MPAFPLGGLCSPVLRWVLWIQEKTFCPGLPAVSYLHQTRTRAGMWVGLCPRRTWPAADAGPSSLSKADRKMEGVIHGHRSTSTAQKAIGRDGVQLRQAACYPILPPSHPQRRAVFHGLILCHRKSKCVCGKGKARVRD